MKQNFWGKAANAIVVARWLLRVRPQEPKIPIVHTIPFNRQGAHADAKQKCAINDGMRLNRSVLTCQSQQTRWCPCDLRELVLAATTIVVLVPAASVVDPHFAKTPRSRPLAASRPGS